MSYSGSTSAGGVIHCPGVAGCALAGGLTAAAEAGADAAAPVAVAVAGGDASVACGDGEAEVWQAATSIAIDARAASERFIGGPPARAA
jgi:hypothetical protein